MFNCFGNEIQLWGKVFFSRDANWHLINDLCFWACSPIFKVCAEKNKLKDALYFFLWKHISKFVYISISISCLFFRTCLVQIVWVKSEKVVCVKNEKVGSVCEIVFCIRIYMVQLLYVLFMAEWAFVRAGSINMLASKILKKIRN